MEMYDYWRIELKEFRDKLIKNFIPHVKYSLQGCKKDLLFANVHSPNDKEKIETITEEIKGYDNELVKYNNYVEYFNELLNVIDSIDEYPKIYDTGRNVLDSIDRIFNFDKEYNYNYIFAYEIERFIEFVDYIYDRILPSGTIHNCPTIVFGIDGDKSREDLVKDFNNQLRSIREVLEVKNK